MYPKLLKRLFDFITASILLLLSAPVILILTILLAVTNNGNIFFVQKRPGKGEKVFKILKFKTMNDRKDAHGKLLPDAERITPWGRFIRKTSLDEVPQLFNVIKGEMSLIGPRPLLESYIPLYNQMQRRRHEIRPGITGWAQVNGRNALSWSSKFELDVWYVDNISFSLDMKILGLTLLKVIKRDGISSDTSATMEVFTGNK